MNSHEVFIHIHQGCFAGTGAIVGLPQCQWSKPDGYGKISQCITTTKHSKAKTVCIFLGIYCIHASILATLLAKHQDRLTGYYLRPQITEIGNSNYPHSTIITISDQLSGASSRDLRETPQCWELIMSDKQLPVHRHFEYFSINDDASSLTINHWIIDLIKCYSLDRRHLTWSGADGLV